MPIHDRNLAAGTRLAANYKKERYVCEVGVDAEGNQTFSVGGKSFKSPSAAASHVMGGQAANGWRFWSLEGEATTADVVAETPVSAPKAERKPKAARSFKLIKKMKEQPPELVGSPTLPTGAQRARTPSPPTPPRRPRPAPKATAPTTRS